MSSETINESRTVPRFSNLRDLTVSYEGRSEEVATRPPDLSSRGMFINTVRAFPVGAVLQVRFKLAHSGAEINTRAEVRYCLAGVGVGVEFLEMNADSVKAIETEISSNPQVTPRISPGKR